MTHPERIIPDETEPGVVALHLKRYEFAAPWCKGRVVLDVACGAGYGTARIAAGAARVVGVDLSDEAIAYARRRYPAGNVEFRTMDAQRLEFEPGSFDVVCSFETIEHLDDRERYLAGVAHVLRDDGVYLVSTPRAEATTEAPDNPYHRVEYSSQDFETLLRRHFDEVELYGQRRPQTMRHRALQRADVLGLRRRLTFLRPLARGLLGTPATAELTTDDVVIDREALAEAAELVAVCRRPRR